VSSADWNPRKAGPISVAAAVATLLIAGGVWTWAGWRYPLPDPGATLPVVRLYAGTQEIAAFQGTSRRSEIWVPLARIPRAVVDAVLATEDRRFFSHWGIDLLAVVRAATTDLRHREVRQGGSTITQQLARTLFLGSERTWGRKLHEAIIALALEFRYPKQRILETYLNAVYMGEDGGVAVQGMGAAARHFLDKGLAAVRLDEAALLAAAISAPNKTFSGSPARIRAARDAVLRAMRGQRMISEAVLQRAMARPVRLATADAALRAPYFVDLARDEIARRVALPPGSEVRIRTTLDPFLQRAGERAIRDGIQRIERRRPALASEKLQAALVAIEPTTGQIRALVGGRRYLDGPFNRATHAARQPGSLFKPIVYLAAFEDQRIGGSPGLTPASLIPDEPTVIRSANRGWAPQNIDRRFHGQVTVRRALEESLNVPAARVAQDVGPDRIVRTAQALGVESRLVPVPSLALGTSEVTLLEITSTFATLANQGIRLAPTTFATAQGSDTARITDLPPPSVRAVSAESSFLVTHILRGVMREGTGRASSLWGLSDITAGKTGTTDGLRDAWFVGYTPDLVIGVWVGMDDGSPLGLTGAQAALPIWAMVMQAAVRRAPPRPFTPPPGVVLVSINRDTGQLASLWCGGAIIEEAFRAGTEPTIGCGGTPLATQARGFFDWFRSLFR
jgi:penicillin-binding protein 1B